LSLIIDASIALRWFVPHEQSPLAEQLLVLPEALLAPDLIIPELTNAAATLVRQNIIPNELGEAIAKEASQPFMHLSPSINLAHTAYKIANSLGHAAYDCFYLALAQQENSQMVTADKKLLNRLKGTQWQHLACTLESVCD
jgi:predicted nucleic acid-binding protein